MKKIDKVIFNSKNNTAIIEGNNIPQQCIHMPEAHMDDWQGIYDKDGNDIFDINIWYDEGYGCQYVNLEWDEKAKAWRCGHDYQNPSVFKVI